MVTAGELRQRNNHEEGRSPPAFDQADEASRLEEPVTSQYPCPVGSGDEDNLDDDDVTIIGLDNLLEQGEDHRATALAWIEQNGPEMEDRRRNILVSELQRVQRSSFIHFIILCLIPTALMLVVVATILSEEDDCSSVATTCIKEERAFVNAFTTRCICDAIDIAED